MASSLKFYVDLDAKLGKLPVLDAVLGRVIKKLKVAEDRANMNKALGAPIGKMSASVRLLNAIAGAATAAGRGITALGKVAKVASGPVIGFARDVLAHFTALATFNGLQRLAGAAVSFGKSLIGAVASGERADAVMRTLAGPENAKNLDAVALRLSKATEFGSDDIQKFANGLLRVGVAAKGIPVRLAIAADIAALTDADPVQTLHDVGAALEGLQTKGGLNFKVLGGMGITREEFFGPLAKKFKIGIDEAEKQVNDGTIKIPMVLQRMKDIIKAKSGKGLGFAALERGEGLSATLGRLERLPGDIFSKLKDTDASKKLNEQLRRVAAMFDPDSPQGKRITDSLTTMLDRIAEMLKGLDLDKFSKDLAAIFSKLPALIDAVTVSLRALVAVAKGLSWLPLKPTQEQTAASGVLKAATGSLSGNPEAKAAGRAALTPILRDAPAMFGGTGKVKFAGSETLANWLGLNDKPAQTGAMVVEGIANGMQSRTAKIASATQGMVDATKNTARDGLEIRSPSKVFERYGELTGEGFARGLASIDRQIMVAAERTFDIPAPAAMVSAAPADTAPRRGAITLNVPITVNYTGTGGGRQTAQEIAESLRQILPSEIRYAFERLTLETGSA